MVMAKTGREAHYLGEHCIIIYYQLTYECVLDGERDKVGFC